MDYAKKSRNTNKKQSNRTGVYESNRKEPDIFLRKLKVGRFSRCIYLLQSAVGTRNDGLEKHSVQDISPSRKLLNVTILQESN